MQVVDPKRTIFALVRWHFRATHEGVENMLSRDVHARNRVFLISALSGVAYIFSSPSALPQASQGMGGVSGQQAFNNACRTCHMVKEGDNRLGPNCTRLLDGKQDRCRTTRFPAQ